LPESIITIEPIKGEQHEDSKITGNKTL